ncbi:unnamed protein product, partial [Effrenium voratum]
LDMASLARFAVQEAWLTHRHPEALGTAAATVLVARALVEGHKWLGGMALF